ncbi:hypothetical protein H6F76_00830 [Leptolyngbya sp. FACHB-321]|nr:hypothetical protein [Leptolyngbya sp. FACHB-321]
MSVAFAPDGQTIVSGSADKTIRLWASPHAIFGKPIRNLADRSRQISIPQSVANDLAQGKDQLNVKDEIEALATVLMLRSLRPPVAIGILGSWGSGKSFGMYLIRQRVNEIRRQKLTLSEAWGTPETPTRTEITSPYVGHIYQIEFNAWTYAKSDLWASLMQEIFYELNRQISLERQLGHILSESRSSSTQAAPTPDLPNTPPKRLVDQFIYTPLTETKDYLFKFIKHIREQLITLIQSILNLWTVQIILHIILLFTVVVFIIIVWLVALLSKILELLAKLFDNLISKKPTFFSKLSKAFDVTRDWFTKQTVIKFLVSVFIEISEWLVQQTTNYYFPSDLRPSNGFLPENVELVLEYILFFLFVGFPKRLSDRRQYWQQISKQSASEPATPQDSAARSELNSDSRAFSQALREGGDFWQVLYLMNEEERTAFLKANLKPDQFKHWKTLTSSAEISNSLWKALDKIKQEEQELFKQNEKTLQDKEKELQRRLKSAEAGVDQQVSQRTFTALWTPLINAVARLRFPSDKIEEFVAAGETGKMLRQTITSWQGLLALFFMTLLIVLSLDAESRVALITSVQTLLDKSGLATQFQHHLPIRVKNTFTSLRDTLLTELKHLPQSVKNLQTKIPAGVKVLTAIAATVTALIPVCKALGEYIKSVQKEQARIQSERDTLLKQE